MRRTSQELDKQIEALEIEQADTHFSGTGLSENGKSVTQLQNEIDALKERKAQVDSQSVLARAQEAIGNLSKEDQNLLRQYRGQELNGYQVRAYAKYDAKTALNEKGYSDDTLKRLAEWQKVLPVMDEALAAFTAEREREGENMRADIAAKKERVKALAGQIAPISEENKAAQFASVSERIRALAGDIPLDENRLLTECAIYADKIAVDEEIVRLASHFEAFDSFLRSSEPVGRKLDFLLQEMNRETNTIGSKSNDSRIAKLVIEMKSELEKIREQIQNIE